MPKTMWETLVSSSMGFGVSSDGEGAVSDMWIVGS